MDEKKPGDPRAFRHRGSRDRQSDGPVVDTLPSAEWLK
jgi:hypothetical protein